MCLIVFGYNCHQTYPFILAGNRDEFYQRPTKQAHFWDTEPEILAGRDLKAGGTWLGMTKEGRIGVLTNYRHFHSQPGGQKSRGELIPTFLKSSLDPKNVLADIISRGHQYDGFNMIAGTSTKLNYISNVHNSLEEIPPGIHGISNGFLNTSWPKVDVAKEKYRSATSGADIDEEAIFSFLKNKETYPQESLPDTGLSPEKEKAVSPIFIELKNYGTRCSTLITVDKNGLVSFVEKSYHKNCESETERRFQFKLR